MTARLAPVDSAVVSDERALGAVQLGRAAFTDAVRVGKIVIEGPPKLVREFPTWLGVTRFARYATDSIAATQAVASG